MANYLGSLTFFVVLFASVEFLPYLVLCNQKQFDPMFARIYGKEIVPHSIPYQALIIFRVVNKPKTFICGGSVVGPRFILTAAQCAKDVVEMDVFLGVHNLSNINPYFMPSYKVHKIIPHEDYRGETYHHKNDIALIILNKKIKWNNNVRSIRMASDLNTNYVGKRAAISGWGKSQISFTSNFLKKAEAKIISNEKCDAYVWEHGTYGDYVDHSNFCTYDRHEASCDDDSGGPVVVDDILVGSRKVNNGSCLGQPGVHTRVSYYFNWIVQKMNLYRF